MSSRSHLDDAMDNGLSLFYIQDKVLLLSINKLNKTNKHSITYCMCVQCISHLNNHFQDESPVDTLDTLKASTTSGQGLLYALCL